ncbi:MAG TPA: hypothetical protein VGI75_15820, partial [Pirellulales bacterium]
MRHRFHLCGFFVAIFMMTTARHAASAADKFYDIPLSDLKITEGKLPKADEESQWNDYDPQGAAKRPRIVLDGSDEAYFKSQDGSSNLALGHIVVRAPDAKEVHGLLFLPKANGTGVARLAFSIAPAQASESAKETYYQTRMDYYARLEDFSSTAGAAWFRHQMNDSL